MSVRNGSSALRAGSHARRAVVTGTRGALGAATGKKCLTWVTEYC